MKNIFAFVGVVLMFSFVFAAGGPSVDKINAKINDHEDSGMINGSDDEGQGVGKSLLVNNTGDLQKLRIQEGERIINGHQVKIKKDSKDQVRLEVSGKSAKASVEIEEEIVDGQSKMSAKLSNGRNAEVKIMPDRASETALARLRLKNCSEGMNCSIELKEVGKNNESKLAYEVKTKRRSKFLGMFDAEMDVEAQVDAETGEVLKVNKPWWAFLASEPEE